MMRNAVSVLHHVSYARNKIIIVIILILLSVTSVRTFTPMPIASFRTRDPAAAFVLTTKARYHYEVPLSLSSNYQHYSRQQPITILKMFPQDRRQYSSIRNSRRYNNLRNQKLLYQPLTSSITKRKTTSALLLASVPGGISFMIDRVVAKASLQATISIVTSISIGGWAAKKKIDTNEKATKEENDNTNSGSAILDGSALHALSKLAYWVFQPAFLLNSVAYTIYQATKKSSLGIPSNLLFLMLLSSLLHIGLGSLVGLFITKVLNPTVDDTDDQYDIRMCTTFANAGPLPLIFNDALFSSSPLIQKNVAACISFYLLVWVPLFWTFGRFVLGISKNQSGATSSENSSTQIQKFIHALKTTLSPPVVGSFIGIIIGCVPLLRSLCFGKGALLAPIMGAVNTLGSAYLPVAILILAGSLFGGGNDGKANNNNVVLQEDNNDDNNDDDACIIVENNQVVCTPYTSPSIRTICSILVGRFVLAPILSFFLLLMYQKLGWFGSAITSSSALSVFCFVLLMEGCMPPTQNSVIMLQLDQLPQRAAKMAKLLTTIYLISIIPITILLSICLSRSGIMAFID